MSVAATATTAAAGAVAVADGNARPSAGRAPILTGAHRTRASVGFGRVRPAEIYTGADPSGIVCDIHWNAWGGPFALGTGTAWYVAPHRPRSDGQWARAVVVLYGLGSWHRRPAYTRYRWYFPAGGSQGAGRVVDCLY